MGTPRIRRLLMAFVSLAILLNVSSVTFADDAHPPKADAAAGEAKKPASSDHGHGKDKLGPFGDIKRYDLGIYTLVVFGILFWILAKFAWGPFTDGLHKREASILAARDEALKAKQEAEELRVKLQADLAKAQEQVRAMLDEARKDADALRQSEREAGVKDAAMERDRARREIESAKEAALTEIYQKAVDLAATMSTKALGREVTPDDHRKLLDESLAELSQIVKPSA